MNNSIKEILDMFTKYKDDWYSCEYKLKPKQCVILYDYITNLQKENEDYKQRNEKAIENIDLVIELIKQQPTEDDSWILNRLNGFKYLLQGEDKGD